MKTFLFGAMTVLAGLVLFMVGVFGSDYALLKSGWGPGFTGGAIPLRQYLIPSAYRFVFAAIAAFLVIRLSRGITTGFIAVVIFGLLILLLEVAGQSELKERVPALWKIVSLASLVAAIALGTALARACYLERETSRLAFDPQLRHVAPHATGLPSLRIR